MKKTLGFTSFEFYFVLSVIGIIVLVAMQRYVYLAEETKRLSFEVVAKHFNASGHLRKYKNFAKMNFLSRRISIKWHSLDFSTQSIV